MSFTERWRSKQHIGPAKPTVVVEIQTGKFKRAYRTWAGDDVHATVPGESTVKPWTSQWQATSDWTALPNVGTFTDNQSFDQNGIKVATLVVSNVLFTARVGALSEVYHLIERGALAPFRGYRGLGRPSAASMPRNEWYDMLTKGTRVRVWQGYGEPEREDSETRGSDMPIDGGSNGKWTFNGLIDDVDLDSDPARITITMRMASSLTDSRIFGWNKSPQCLDPLTFIGSDAANKRTYEGGGAAASTSREGHPPSFVTDKDPASAWHSAAHSTPDVTEYVEVRLPAGRYRQILVHPEWEGMDLYAGIYAHGTPTLDGESIPAGWVHVGNGNVPGDHGGWAYMRKMTNHSAEQRLHDLGHTVEVGDNSILRIGFRSLQTDHFVSSFDQRPRYYRAGLRRLAGQKLALKQEASGGKMIVVDDLSDMVKVVLRWAGFEEWEIQDTGTSLTERYVVDRSTFLIDPIRKAVEATGFVFYVEDPSDGDSLGVPVFRQNGSLDTPDGIVELRDTDLLTGLKVKLTEEPLAYNIRVRGKEAKKKDGGVTTGSSRVRRIQVYYKPPWARHGRLSGVIKHVTHTFNDLRTKEQCQVACYLIALNQALQYATAVAECPGNPFFGLDAQVGLVDTDTGMNTRLWIANRESSMVLGAEDPSWKTTIGGSLIDTPDIFDLLDEINSKVPRPPGIYIGNPPGVGGSR